MPEPLIVVDSSELRQGRIQDVKRAFTGLVDHPDSASMEHHMAMAGPAFGQFAGLLRMSTMDIHGEPSNQLLDTMRPKARLLGAGSIAVRRLRAGFTRLHQGA